MAWPRLLVVCVAGAKTQCEARERPQSRVGEQSGFIGKGGRRSCLHQQRRRANPQAARHAGTMPAGMGVGARQHRLMDQAWQARERRIRGVAYSGTTV
jgi:hypothetical protein